MPSLPPPALPVELYDAAERHAHEHLSIPHLMAFRPVAFEMVGWPTRVKTEAELARYVDHNFEAEVPGLFRKGAVFEPIGYRNSFTHDESDAIAEVRGRVGELTEQWFGRRILPVSNLLVQIGPFRAMQQLSSLFNLPTLRIFEVGPGAGYLGALLAQVGHRYLSYDVTQSIYLWQSRLLQAIAGPDFVELAGVDDGDKRRQLLIDKRIVHMPWWQYVDFAYRPHVDVDVVYSNSNLSEMSRLSLRHVLEISRQMLAKSRVGVFCFFSKGMPAQTPHEQIDDEFRNFGYFKILDQPLTIFSLRPEHKNLFREAFKTGISSFNPTGRGGKLTARDVVPIKRSEAPLDTQITRWIHGWEPPYVD